LWAAKPDDNQIHKWERKDPVLDTRGLPLYVNETKQSVDHYTPDEQEQLKMTDRISVSTYIQGNGPETETYTDQETAYEIRIALRESLRISIHWW
jgi:hypothetical protein